MYKLQEIAAIAVSIGILTDTTHASTKDDNRHGVGFINAGIRGSIGADINSFFVLRASSNDIPGIDSPLG